MLVAFIWGTNFVFIRYGLDELGPFSFAALRFMLVAFPLIFIFPKPKTSWLNLASYGLFIGFGQFGLLYWAMQNNISPGLASLIIQMQVFFCLIVRSLRQAVFPQGGTYLMAITAKTKLQSPKLILTLLKKGGNDVGRGAMDSWFPWGHRDVSASMVNNNSVKV